MYSPDDGDYQGFLSLIRAWVDARKLAIPDSAVQSFAGTYARVSQSGKLRSDKQWVKLLRQHAGTARIIDWTDTQRDCD